MPTVAPLDLDGYCVSAAFVGGVTAFALADGTVHRLDGGHKTNELHDGLLSVAVARNRTSLVTGGEDGRVCRLGANWQAEETANLGNKWVTSVAAGPDGIVGFASGRSAYVNTPRRRPERVFPSPLG